MALLLLALAFSPQFTDSRSHFACTPPPGWRQVAAVPPAIAVFVGPRMRGFAENLVISAEPAGKNLRDPASLTTRLDTGQVYGKHKFSIDGWPAAGWHTHVRLKGMAPLENRQAAVITDKTLFAITLSSAPGRMASLTGTWDAVIRSVSLGRMPAPKPVR